MIKLAIVQHPPVYLDKDKSTELATRLIADARAESCDMVVFPEAWLPGYPDYVWRLAAGTQMQEMTGLFAVSQAQSVDIARGDLTPIQRAAKEHGVVVVLGHQEIDSTASATTLFNSVAIIDADGKLLNNHRKLMPTAPERMVWGFGDGSTLRVVETAVGRVGALLCWENYMPLARYAIYAQNVEIYCAPTWDCSSYWLATMQHIAREGGCWVVGCSTPMEAADIPTDLPFRSSLGLEANEWINSGEAVVYKPFAGVHAGPMSKKKGFLFAEIDIADVGPARQRFDATGHYARPDVFELLINQERQLPVRR